MPDFATWMSDNETTAEGFRQEIEDLGFAVDVYRPNYGNGVLGVDMAVGEEMLIRTVAVRVEEAKTLGKQMRLFGFTTDTDVRENDHWRYRDRNGWEQFYTVTAVIAYPYGTIAELKDGK
jgi:hypothetical protein